MKTQNQIPAHKLLLAVAAVCGSMSVYAQTQLCDGCVGAMGSTVNCNTVTLVNPSPTPSTSPVALNDPQFQLVFEDQFNGTAIDLNKWNYGGYIPDDPNYAFTTDANALTGTKGQNVSVSGGYAHLLTTYAPGTIYLNQDNIFNSDPNDDYESRNYMTGSIQSDFLFGTGKFEIRCKIPQLIAQWPAFWLYAFSEDGYDYNHNQEIDCFEIKQNVDANVGNCEINAGCDSYFDPYQASKRMIMTSHYKEEVVPFGQECAPQMCYIGTPLVDDFHTYTLIWDEHIIQWYVDNVLVHTQPRFVPLGGNGYLQHKDFPSPNLPMRIIISNSVWIDYIAHLYDEVNNEATCGGPVMPSDFLIDYVKVWKRDCNTNEVLCADNGPNYMVDFAAGNLSTSPTCSQWVVNSGQTQRFTASNEISLKNFHAVPGSRFRAFIVGCNGQLPRSAEQDAPAIQEIAEAQAELLPGAMMHEGNPISDLQVVPNPSDGDFSVAFSSDAGGIRQVYVYNMYGKLALTEKIMCNSGKNTYRFFAQHLSPGVYTIFVEGVGKGEKLIIH